MKKIMLIIFVFASLSLIQCKNPLSEATNSINRLEQKLSVKQLQEIAKKYDLQDSINNKGSEYLYYLSYNEADKELKNLRFNYDIVKDDIEFTKKVHFIKSVDDYINLINSFPRLKQREIEGRGEEGFKKWADELRAKKMHIYVNDQGVVGFIPAELDDNTDPSFTKRGKRVDTLKD